MIPSLSIKVMETFSEQHIYSVKRYYTTLMLTRNGLSNKNIHNKLGVTLDNVTTWKNGRHIPIAVKTLQEFEQRYNRDYTFEELLAISYLVGYNLGDGNVSRNYCNSWFYGICDDLEIMKELFVSFHVKPVVYRYKINNGKMAVHDRVFSRFLYCFGAVSGDKTALRYQMPNWIVNSPEPLIKVRFLQGLFDSELCCLRSVRKNAYDKLSFYHSKRIDLVDEGTFFLNQVKALLLEFGVRTSPVRKDRTYVRKRDGSKMQQLFFYIYGNSVNLYKFLLRIGFLYNSKRRLRAEEALPSLKKRSSIEETNLLLYSRVVELRNTGMSAYAIAKELQLTANKVKSWVYGNHKPRSYYFSSNS